MKNSNSMLDYMREVSKNQLSVHSQIASGQAPATGTGEVTIHAYLVAGTASGTFTIDGQSYSFKAKFPFVGWANGTVNGSINLLVSPQSLVGADTGFTFTCSTTAVDFTFYLNGVAVGTFSGGDGISGGGAAAGSCDWTNG